MLEEIIPNSYIYLLKWVNGVVNIEDPFAEQNDPVNWDEFLGCLAKYHEYPFLSIDDLEQWLRDVADWPDDSITKTLLRYEEMVDIENYQP